MSVKRIIEELLEKESIEEDSDFKDVIEKVRNSDVFGKIIREVKEEYFVEDKVHGITHNERVALIACYIGIKKNLNLEDMKILIYSAL